jgi:hypothetical protein
MQIESTVILSGAWSCARNITRKVLKTKWKPNPTQRKKKQKGKSRQLPLIWSRMQKGHIEPLEHDFFNPQL